MNNQEIKELAEKYVMNTYGPRSISLVKGQGSKVWDADGKEYLDMLAGIAVNNLGHCHPVVVKAIQNQAEKLLHVSNLYLIEPQVQAAKILVENSFADKAFFCNSGAEANEGAIKMARRYGKEQGGEEKHRIISMLNSFHGRTLATLTATGQTKYQKGFEPLPPGFDYIPFGDVPAAEKTIDDTVCGVIVEPVQGEGGVNVAGENFLRCLRDLCDKHKALLIYDEVQCGLGRTGKLFAYQHYGIEPEVMTLAKSLGGGAPIGAILAKEKGAHCLPPGTHAATFGGNPLVCTAAVATLTFLIENDLPAQALEKGNYMIEQLKIMKERHKLIKDIRGLGLMIGVEVGEIYSEIMKKMVQKGVLVGAAMGNTIRFLPPLTISKEEIEYGLTIFEEVINEIERAE